jgi:UDP-N-acetylglucosamine acyltransferase
MSKKIHATAIVADGAKLGKNVEIGAYCVIGGNVVLGDNVKLHSHVVVDGYTSIGEGTRIFPFASIGHEPQDLKFKGEKSRLEIGKNNTIREHVTMNPGTEGDNLITKVGDNCLFMMSSHVAHDCMVGNNVILANNATLAGHVNVGDYAILGGLSAVHQYVRIGHHAMIGGMSGIENDVIPYGQAMGERASLVGLNLIGLKRGKFERDEIHSLRNAYRLIFSQEGTLQERIDDASELFKGNKGVMEILEFIRANTSRAICQPKTGSIKNADAA